ncbi:MAG: GIY-YIG nuclease family protein [Candidatus Zixiibacteriota bacterium]|nr:MAG: GIY-YIG nuclease family protein [candidate division Zixibacteria bacterium]
MYIKPAERFILPCSSVGRVPPRAGLTSGSATCVEDRNVSFLSWEGAIFTIYILQSKASKRYYCGHTRDLEVRLRQHNDPEYRGSLTTKRFTGPWVSVWRESRLTRGEAMKLERQIKRRGIARFLDGAKSAESRRRRD